MTRWTAVLLSAVFLAGCAGTAQRREREAAESAIADAVTALAAARRAGADKKSRYRWEVAEDELATARSRLAAREWAEALRRARASETAAQEAEKAAVAAPKSKGPPPLRKKKSVAQEAP